MKKYFKELSFKLAVELSKWILLAIVGVIISYITPILLTNRFIVLSEFKILTYIVVVSVMIIIFIILYQKYNKFRPNLPRIDSHFLILERELTHIWHNENVIEHKRRFVLQALQHGLDNYTDKFVWTGGDFKIKSGIIQHKVNLIEKRNFFDIYEVKFDKVLRKGDIIEIEIVWDLYNNDKKARPYFSVTIEEPTKNLILNLGIDPKFNVKEILTETSYVRGSKIPLNYKTIKLDREGKAKWEINNPKLLYTYEIKWKFHEITKKE